MSLVFRTSLLRPLTLLLQYLTNLVLVVPLSPIEVRLHKIDMDIQVLVCLWRFVFLACMLLSTWDSNVDYLCIAGYLVGLTVGQCVFLVSANEFHLFSVFLDLISIFLRYLF